MATNGYEHGPELEPDQEQPLERAIRLFRELWAADDEAEGRVSWVDSEGYKEWQQMIRDLHAPRFWDCDRRPLEGVPRAGEADSGG